MKSGNEVLQEGLYEKNPKEVERLVQRVTNFNMDHVGNAVKLDISPCEKGDRHCADPHYKLRLLFPSREIMVRFWSY